MSAEALKDIGRPDRPQDDDHLHLLPDEEPPVASASWRVLVVDDEPEVHRVTALALDGFRFQDRPLQLISAFSAAEAMAKLDADPHIALVLLDVVMERDDAGFAVVKHIRETLSNAVIRIILRTGQPGQAPAREVIRRYEINDYHSKAELTADRMFIALYTGLAMYDYLSVRQQRERQLERAYADIEQLVFIASHDLQEPLRRVGALGKRLLGVNRDQLDANGRQCLDYLLAAIERMSSLVRDLREHARLGRPAAVQAVDMAAVFGTVCADLQTQIAAAHAVIEHGDLSSVHGQPEKLALLLRHLLINALQYRRTDVPLRVRLDVVPAAESGFRQWILRDNGRGIAADHKHDVFKVFHRVDAPPVPSDDPLRSGGTGIGLAHCRKIVDQHGGRIWVEDTPGGGASLCFTLPEVY